MFKNMKIEINEAQPLYEVVIELERLGFERSPLFHKDCLSIGIYPDYMKFDCYKNLDVDNVDGCKTTTLAELKEMKCKI